MGDMRALADAARRRVLQVRERALLIRCKVHPCARRRAY